MSSHSANGSFPKQNDFPWRKSHSEAPSPQYNSPRPNHQHQNTRSYNNSPYGSRPHSHFRRSGNPNTSRNSSFESHQQDFHGALPYDGPDNYQNKGHSGHRTHYSSPRSHNSLNSQHSKIPLKIPKNTWLFAKEEVETYSPSILDGMTVKEESFSKSKGINFIFQVATLLKLPQMVTYTAATFLHRFYLRNSLKRFHQYDMGATCLFLATKVEDASRKLKDVSIACAKVALKNPNLVVDEQSREFWRWKDLILVNEELLLEALTFDLTLESPYAILSKFVDFLNIPEPSVRKSAWAFVNDSCRTSLCVIFPTSVIAAAAIRWSLTINHAQPPDPSKWRDPNKTQNSSTLWWEHPFVNVSKDDLDESVSVMMDFYETHTNSAQPKPAATSQEVPEKRKADSSDNSHEPGQKKPKLE